MDEISKDTFAKIGRLRDQMAILFDICHNTREEVREIKKILKRRSAWDKTLSTLGGFVGGIVAWISTMKLFK